MVRKETCIEAKLYNDVFGQASYPTDKLIQFITACWCLYFYTSLEFQSALIFSLLQTLRRVSHNSLSEHSRVIRVCSSAVC